ncbi:MAG TPA: hypothetical protein VED01_21380 [Burkholderiales bacterium]|nr:hypothetical protein [Burkholderiales bacterium]
MIEVIYAGVWLAGIVAAWDMVRRATGARDVRALRERIDVVFAALPSLHSADDDQAKHIHALEAKVPELEKQIAAVRGMVQQPRRVGLGIR